MVTKCKDNNVPESIFNCEILLVCWLLFTSNEACPKSGLSGKYCETYALYYHIFSEIIIYYGEGKSRKENVKPREDNDLTAVIPRWPNY